MGGPPDGAVPSTVGFSRLIVFDKRGTGMSDRPSEEGAALLEDRVNDIAGLMDTVGPIEPRSWVYPRPERSRPVRRHLSRANESRHRVRRVPGWWRRQPDLSWGPYPEQAAWLEDIERKWGRGVLYLDEFGSRRDDPHYQEWFAKLERLSASPGAAVAVARMSMQTDVRHVLPTIRVPTLVLHKRDDKAVPLPEGGVHRRPRPRCEVRRAPGRGSLALDRTRRGGGRDPGVPDQKMVPGARSLHRDRDVRRHRRLDDARGGTR